MRVARRKAECGEGTGEEFAKSGARQKSSSGSDIIDEKKGRRTEHLRDRWNGDVVQKTRTERRRGNREGLFASSTKHRTHNHPHSTTSNQVHLPTTPPGRGLPAPTPPLHFQPVPLPCSTPVQHLHPSHPCPRNIYTHACSAVISPRTIPSAHTAFVPALPPTFLCVVCFATPPSGGMSPNLQQHTWQGVCTPGRYPHAYRLP